MISCVRARIASSPSLPTWKRPRLRRCSGLNAGSGMTTDAAAGAVTNLEDPRGVLLRGARASGGVSSFSRGAGPFTGEGAAALLRAKNSDVSAEAIQMFKPAAAAMIRAGIVFGETRPHIAVG